MVAARDANPEHVDLQIGSRKVVSGPFCNMIYGEESLCSRYYPKLLGTYEQELWDTIEKVCSSAPKLIIDVGAAEGYYAVGMALRLPEAEVIAFEACSHDPIRRLSLLNAVADRVNARGICDISSLRAALSRAERRFVLMDIEGGEAMLLNPVVVPELMTTEILVELHEFVIPGVGALMRGRFAETHAIVEISAQERTVHDIPFPVLQSAYFHSEQYYLEYLNEARPTCMSWLYMSPSTCVWPHGVT